MDKQKALNLIGLAYRAKKVTRGEDSTLSALQTQKTTLVFVAKDASERTKDQFLKKCFFYHVPVSFDFSTEELSKAIGRPMCKIMAITDQGFQKALEKILNRGEENES
jgi:ribosomal protein L7Ae-like RNA K-turn-binding protein